MNTDKAREFLAVVRSGRFDVDDLYERKALDNKAE